MAAEGFAAACILTELGMVEAQVAAAGGVGPPALFAAAAGTAATPVGILDRMHRWLDGAGAPQRVSVCCHVRHRLELAADEGATQLLWQLLDEESLEGEAVGLLVW